MVTPGEPRGGRLSTTRWGVRVADVAARLVITSGGIGTILSVCLVCVFLVWVTLPLFLPAKVLAQRKAQVAPIGAAYDLRVDPLRTMAYTITADGRLVVFRLDTGRVLEQRRLFADRVPTAFSCSLDGTDLAVGFSDGTIQLGRISFTVAYLDPATQPPPIAQLAPGERAELDRGLVVFSSAGQLQQVQVETSWESPIVSQTTASVVLIDHVVRPTGPAYCALSADGRLVLASVRKRKNLLTGQMTLTPETSQLPFHAHGRGLPARIFLPGLGDNVYLLWTDGHLVRYDTREPANARVAEELDLIPEPGVELTAAGLMPGRATLLVGDSLGRVHAWFRVKPEISGTVDGARLTLAHALAPGEAAVVALSPSTRTRTVAVLYADHSIRLHYVTGATPVASVQIDGAALSPVQAKVVMAPKDDGLAVLSSDGLYSWQIDLRHPEATLRSLFRPVWYEGYTEPAHVWQSTGGTDDFEPKLGLFPLVFGTVKATFYSMLFAVPIALLAAVYTSEFLHRRTRARIKPAIELMASLPSVVLGFLAALVIAPFAERVVPALLACLVTLPLVFLSGAYVWQLLPRRIALRFASRRLLITVVLIFVGIALAFPVGNTYELWLLGGDIRRWLDGQVGTGTGGWMLLLLPLSALAVAVFNGRIVNPWLMQRAATFSALRWACTDLIRFLASVVVVFGAAWLLALGLTALGADPRGFLFGTFVQRNALVVGFVMGFAVIPIIYTIADDALSTVPYHLRSASLAAGATPWQTAVRVVIPTAMSGLFSAAMVGLGRAVGETMIVLMAAGNTPVLEWNPFNGFRTLSANIAVELPEAVRDSTHYRTLFLAALLLFLLTFLVNTAAEIIRLRFRKRAYQL